METCSIKPKRATKSIFHSQFHSFAPILDHWQVADIKSHEDQKEQERATKSSKIKRATKDQNEHRG